MKPQGKKLPKWAIPVGIAGVLAIVIVMRKKATPRGKATEPGSEGLTNQSFIPVTGENVPGAGAQFGGVSPSSNEGALVSFLKAQNEEASQSRREQTVENRESIERERNFFQETLRNLGVGGGAPTSNGAPGTTVAPAPSGGTTPTPPPVVIPTPPPGVPAAKCPSEFPDYNPANGAPGPHSCYKYSRERCPNKAFPYKHVYQDGHFVCSPV